jgi:hypothetical protein
VAVRLEKNLKPSSLRTALLLCLKAPSEDLRVSLSHMQRRGSHPLGYLLSRVPAGTCCKQPSRHIVARRLSIRQELAVHRISSDGPEIGTRRSPSSLPEPLCSVDPSTLFSGNTNPVPWRPKLRLGGRGPAESLGVSGSWPGDAWSFSPINPVNRLESGLRVGRSFAALNASGGRKIAPSRKRYRACTQRRKCERSGGFCRRRAFLQYRPRWRLPQNCAVLP